MGNPTVRVAVNGNILKHYNSEVFLQDRAEFQLEINNPTSERLKAELSVNGKKESTALLLRPGERIFLKRFLDADSKFIFSEYTVPGENAAAIAANGIISVVFLKEYTPQPQIIGGWSIDGIYNNHRHPSMVSPFIYSSNTGGFSKSLNTTTGALAITGTIEASSGNIGSFTNSVAPEIKTGIVEKGEQSGQMFNEIQDRNSWVYYSISTVKILPLSQKPPEVQVRQYCPHCGAKVKPDWKYCPQCGKSIW